VYSDRPTRPAASGPRAGAAPGDDDIAALYRETQ